MRKFNILQVTSLSQIAGTELSTFMLSKELKRRGHDISIFCNNGPLTEDFRKQGIQVILGDAYPRHLFSWEALKTIYALKICIENNGIDILHVQTATCLPLVFLANKWSKRKAKFIWHCRGLSPKNYNIVSRFANFATDFIITNCNSEKSKIEINGVPKHKIKTIYNPPPSINIPSGYINKDTELLKELKVNEGAFVVASVSRLEVDRGVQYYLEAASKLVNNYNITNIIFIIVGDGPLKNKLKEESRKFGISDYVLFLGVRRDIERVYASIDLLVNPNLLGMGTDNINAEAMAFYKPVVAAEVGGIPEIVIDGENGFLVPPRDSEAIAEKILLLLKSEELRKNMGEAGRKRIEEHFTPEKLGDEIEKVYMSLVADSI